MLWHPFGGATLRAFLTIVPVGVAVLLAIPAKSEDWPSPPAIALPSTVPVRFDRRLDAIARAPDLLDRLDQRRNFQTTERYSEVLHRSVSAAARVLPEVSAEQHIEHLVTAVCVGDERVFFWLPASDRDVIGWIPLEVGEDQMAQDSLVLWLAPRSGASSTFSQAWSTGQRSVTNPDWTRNVVKSGLHIDIEAVDLDGNDGWPVATSSFKRDGAKHEIELMATDDVLQAKIALLSDKEKEMPGKPKLPERYLNDLPVVLPFWPPSQED
jgi:hypothetical protein